LAVKPFNDIVPLVPPHVVGLVNEVDEITGVAGFVSVIGPAEAEVHPLIVTVKLEYVPAGRLPITIEPDAFAVNDCDCGVPAV
jgi:hypothetical protein